MKQLLYWMLGYTDLSVSQGAIKTLLNFSNQTAIEILSLKICGESARVRVYARHEAAILSGLHDGAESAVILHRRGLPFIWKRYRHRVGILLGFVFLFTVLFISPMFVWEVNVTGLDRLNREYVMELLAEQGVYVGAFSPRIDRRAVYVNILRSSADISWLSVNIRGSSANVEIVEREYLPVAEQTADGANIVAAKDGYLIDANVLRGRLAAAKGTVVQKGEILVSGVYDTKQMGTRYVYAEAAVYAVVNDVYTIEIPLKNIERVYGEETVLETSLKMFGKSINIFKNSSFSAENYDTIHRDDTLGLFGLDQLPLSLETVCALPFSDIPVLLTEEEALERAKREAVRKIDEEAEYEDLLALEESYVVEDAILRYQCEVEAVENIAAVSEFYVD